MHSPSAVPGWTACGAPPKPAGGQAQCPGATCGSSDAAPDSQATGTTGVGGGTATAHVDFQHITAGGPQQLIITGNGGTAATYGGTVSFILNAAAVPEPAAWALMIVGFGGVGAMLRRRREMGVTA